MTFVITGAALNQGPGCHMVDGFEQVCMGLRQKTPVPVKIQGHDARKEFEPGTEIWRSMLLATGQTLELARFPVVHV